MFLLATMVSQQVLRLGACRPARTVLWRPGCVALPWLHELRPLQAWRWTPRHPAAVHS